MQDVEGTLGSEHRLQFHVLIKSMDCLCLSYAFSNPSDVLYFVFKNGKLDRISEPPPFDYRLIDSAVETPEWKGGKISIRAPVDPWARMDLVLTSRDLSGQAAVDSVLRRCPQDRSSLSHRSRLRHCGTDPALPAHRQGE